MIKLDLPPKPNQLTDEFQAIKTQEFIDSGKTKNVWNIDWLKDAVFQMAFGKCCYSEARLGEESKNMEIEHFAPKSLYPHMVMEWGNLLPSLKKCNGTKLDLDVVKEPIINPFENNPKEYFKLIGCRYYPLNENLIVAKRSIEKLSLNHRKTFVNKRFEISKELIIKLEDIKKDFENYDDKIIPIERLKRLMKTGNRKEEYSALVASTILSNQNYKEKEDWLRINLLWDEEFESLKQELLYCALL